MAWPTVLEYNEAIQHPSHCFQDADLRLGQVATNAMGWPMPCTGNFAAVYRLAGPNQRTWAVKCFTREVANLQQRYQAISDHLRQARQQPGLPFMVDFDYLVQGIRCAGRWYPVLKMSWVEGFSLNGFVKDYIDKGRMLTALAQVWLALARDLRTARMAHGDLQHGNVILVPKEGAVSLKLIDYDGMFVPALSGSKSGELGHPNYQHSGRGDDPFHAEVDRFAHLVIYTALRSLAVGGRSLWERYDNGDNLLFREEDFKAPGGSAVFRELWKLQDPSARALVGHLLLACEGPPRDVPLLADLVGNGQGPTLSPDQQTRVSKMLQAPTAQGPEIVWGPPFSTPAPASGGTSVPATLPARSDAWWALLLEELRAPGHPPVQQPREQAAELLLPPEDVLFEPDDVFEFAEMIVPIARGVTIQLTYIPSGAFLRGSPPTEAGREIDEGLLHEVTLQTGYYLGASPVTQAQWQAVMGTNPSKFNGAHYPVETVSWDDCQEFCRELSSRTGKRFRLPTEAQWEYACRAGTTTAFSFGRTISTAQANYNGNHTYGRGRKGVFREQTTPVSMFPANAWGLYDMHGNVREWCADYYGAYTTDENYDRAEGGARVVRGGSWWDGPRRCRSAYRNGQVPSGRNEKTGCRVLLWMD